MIYATQLLEALPPEVKRVCVGGDPGWPWVIYVFAPDKRRCVLTAQEGGLPIADVVRLVADRCGLARAEEPTR